MTATTDVRVRRVYDLPDPADGQRVLVDRLWPRGLSKSAAALDEWVKAVAPSDELRRWYGHEASKFPAFRERYQAELPVRVGLRILLSQARSNQVEISLRLLWTYIRLDSRQGTHEA